MKIKKGKKADAVYVQFRTGSVKKTKKISDNVLIDFDGRSRVLGNEVLSTSVISPALKVVSKTKLLSNKISKIISADSNTLAVKVKFKDGFVGTVDLSYIFLKPKALAAEVIKRQLFEKCFIESGALSWPNGLELCPDSLRMRAQGTKERKTTG